MAGMQMHQFPPMPPQGIMPPPPPMIAPAAMAMGFIPTSGFGLPMPPSMAGMNIPRPPPPHLAAMMGMGMGGHGQMFPPPPPPMSRFIEKTMVNFMNNLPKYQ
jgi:hypothetical protein